MSIAKTYCKRVKKDTRIYFAHWLPTSTVNLGTVGVLVDGAIFVPKTSLAQLGIAFDVEDDQASSPLDFTSSHDVRIGLKLAGTLDPASPTIPQAKAGFVVEFGRKAAYVIKAEESYEPRIRNVAALEAEILERIRARTWDPQWAVISQIVHTPAASILISQTSSARVEITAEGNVNLGEQAKLGDATGEFRITSESGKVFNFLNTRNATPLFQLVGMKKNPFGRTRVGTLNVPLGPTSVAGLSADEVARDEALLSSLRLEEL